MGTKRFIKRWLLKEWGADAMKNIKEEGGIVAGVKRTLKEDITEDFPLTSMVYKSGKYDGKKEGYEEASDEYETKLLQQADAFLKQEKTFENQREEYEALLNDYEAEIAKLTEKVNMTEDENRFLQQLLLKERALKALVS